MSGRSVLRVLVLLVVAGSVASQDKPCPDGQFSQSGDQSGMDCEMCPRDKPFSSADGMSCVDMKSSSKTQKVAVDHHAAMTSDSMKAMKGNKAHAHALIHEHTHHLPHHRTVVRDKENKLCPVPIAPKENFNTWQGKQGCCILDKVLEAVELVASIRECHHFHTMHEKPPADTDETFLEDEFKPTCYLTEAITLTEDMKACCSIGEEYRGHTAGDSELCLRGKFASPCIPFACLFLA